MTDIDQCIENSISNALKTYSDSTGNLKTAASFPIIFITDGNTATGADNAQTITSSGTYFSISNESTSNSLNFTISGITITVGAGKAFDGCFTSFTSISVTATSGQTYNYVVGNLSTAPQLPAPIPSPPGVPIPMFGVGACYGQSSMVAIPSATLTDMTTCGLTYVRVDFKWMQIEQSRGVYTWTNADALINSIINAGMTPYLILDYNNTLYAAGELYGISTQANLNAYINWVTLVANRYKGKKVIYELWNEPNIPGQFWLGTDGADATVSGQYYNLVKSAYIAMKAQDPNCYIVGGVISFMGNFASFLSDLCNDGFLHYVDALSYHAYDDDHSPEQGGQDYLWSTVKTILSNNGNPSIPLINSEVGFSNYDTTMTQSWTAQMLPRLFLYDLYKFGVKIMNIYSWQDVNTADAQREDNFGLLNSSGSHKTQYAAVQSLCQAIAGRTYSGAPLASNGNYCLTFKGTSNVTYAYWTTGSNNNQTVNGHSLSLTSTVQYSTFSS